MITGRILRVLALVSASLASWAAFGGALAAEDGDGIVTRHAVVVGISSYRSVSSLSYAHLDALDFRARLLQDSRWRTQNIALLVNRQATKAAIQSAIAAMAARADADDLCLFFFSGHGNADTDLEPLDEADHLDEYLVPYDATATLSTQIRDDELSTWTGTVHAGTVVAILDACFSGGQARGFAAAKSTRGIKTINFSRFAPAAGDGLARDLAGGRRMQDLDDLSGIVVLSACAEDELCGEDSELRQGILTFYLLEAMNTWRANADGDAELSAEEAFAYLRPRSSCVWYPDPPERQHAQLVDAKPGEADFVAAVPGGPASIIASFNMDSAPAGWSATGGSAWAWGTPTGGNGDSGDPDPAAGHTGSAVYGFALNGGYTNDMAEASVTAGPFNCSGYSGVSIRFWRWLGVEDSTFDDARLLVSNDGATWSTVWRNFATPISDTEWVPYEYDISSAADGRPAVYLRWTMGPTDESMTSCGWNIDDVELRGFAGRRLTVCSTPIPGVQIAGDKPGIADYTADCDIGQTVALSAPQAVSVAGTDYTFLRWTVDGEPIADAQTDVFVTMDTNHAAAAIYSGPASARVAMEHPSRENLVVLIGVGDPADPLWVKDLPIPADGPLVWEADVSAASAWLPPSAASRWFLSVSDTGSSTTGTITAFELTYDGQAYPCASTPAAISPGAISLAFIPGAPVLSVDSSPCTGVAITGNRPGTTPYSVFCESGEIVNLAAPDVVNSYEFVRWVIDGANQPEGVLTVQVEMNSSHALQAIYGGGSSSHIVIRHTYRGDLVVKIGVGDPARPAWIATVSDRQGGSENDVIATVDIAAASAYLPPGPSNIWFLSVADKASGDSGSIDEFTITHLGETYASSGPPVPITDYGTSFAWIPSPIKLTVESWPLPGVAITGDRAGTTTYTAICGSGETTSLSAPPAATLSSQTYTFVRWLIDGVDQPEGVAAVQVTMDRHHTVCARYNGAPVAHVFVRHSYRGDLVVKIGVGDPAQPAWVTTISDRQGDGNPDLAADIILTSALEYLPPSPANPWYLEVADRDSGDTGSIESFQIMFGNQTYTCSDTPIPVTDYRTSCAYIPSIRRLTVDSVPVAGIGIAGSRPGTTLYSVICDDGETVNLAAPETFVAGESQYVFQHWVLDGTDRPAGQTAIEITMSTSDVARAVYRGTVFANVVIRHTFRGDLVVKLGVGAPEQPSWITTVSDRQGGGADDIIAEVDVTPGTAFLPPGPERRWFLQVLDDAGGDEGIIESFRITFRDQTYAAADTPVPVSDYHTSYSWIPSGWRLVVLSTPVDGVPISGTAAGTTDYDASGTAPAVTLTAPLEHVDGQARLRFVRWKVDDTPMPDGQTTIEFTVSSGHEYVAVAVYEYVSASAVMTLEGPGERGEILPPGPGTFIVKIYGQGFQALVGLQTVLQFMHAGGSDAKFLVHESAGPLFEGLDIVHNDELYPSIYSFGIIEPGDPWYRRLFGFINWTDDNPVIVDRTWLLTVRYDYAAGTSGTFVIDPHPPSTLFAGPSGEIPFQVVSGSVTIRETCRLSVTSTPITGVPVSGSKPGTTDYTASCQPGEPVNLSVPRRTTAVGGTEYVFVCWVLDGVNQPPLQADLQFTVSGDHTAASVWTIPGDLNGDCKANVLDLIIVRNRLGSDPSSGDNGLADLNGDGRINVLDLIQTRNRLGSACGPAPRDCGPASLLTDVATGENSITIFLMSGGLPAGDVISVTFNGTEVIAPRELDSIEIPVTLGPGENCLSITAVSEGSAFPDGVVAALVIFSGVT
ncbi:MAG TPA: caspase family protein, partial [Planctomycetota bacterium]|nr:caspase family protein [Planctomycetota bacterium]